MAAARVEQLPRPASHSGEAPGPPRDQPGLNSTPQPTQIPPHRVVVEDKEGDAKYLIHLDELDEPHSSVEAVMERFHTEGSHVLVVD